jgi:hypothetical protein
LAAANALVYAFYSVNETKAQSLDLSVQYLMRKPWWGAGESTVREKVFGIGLSRTGTTSLTEALRALGYRAVHCPLSIVAFNGSGLKLNPAIVEQFDAFTDSPVARVYRELDQAYPGSKFILTTRPLDKWMNSMRRMRPSFTLLSVLPKVRQLARDLGGTASFGDESALANSFLNHNRSVREYFGSRIGKDLLVLDVSAVDAWDGLCSFLGHNAARRAFPHYNRGYGTTLVNMRDLIRYAWPLT